MVTRAQENARRNGIDNARFYKADLSGDIVGMSWAGKGSIWYCWIRPGPGRWR